MPVIGGASLHNVTTSGTFRRNRTCVDFCAKTLSSFRRPKASDRWQDTSRGSETLSNVPPAARLGYSGEPCATFTTPCSSIGRLSLAEWIGLNACVRGDSWSATSGAEQPAGKSNDSRPFRLRTQGAMPRCAHTSSTRSNSRGLHSRARGRRISARGCIASAPAWYARALDFSRITAHILSHRRDIARYIRISNPSRSRSTSSHRSARCHRRRPIRCDGIRWTTSVCAGRVAFAHR